MRGLTIQSLLTLALLACAAHADAVERQKALYWWPWRCKTPEVFPQQSFYGYYPTCWKKWQLNCPNCPPSSPGEHPQRPYDGMIIEGAGAESVAPGTRPAETLPDGSRPSRPGEGTFPPVQPLFPDAPPLILPDEGPGETPGDVPGAEPFPPFERPTDLPPTTPEGPMDEPPAEMPGALPEAPAETPGLQPEAALGPPSDERRGRLDGPAHDARRREQSLTIKEPHRRPEPPTSPSVDLLRQTLDETRFDVTAPRPPLASQASVHPAGTDLPPASPEIDPAAVSEASPNSAPGPAPGSAWDRPRATASAARPTPAATMAESSTARPNTARLMPPRATPPAPRVAATTVSPSTPAAVPTTRSPEGLAPSAGAPTVATSNLVVPAVAQPTRAQRRAPSPVVRATAIRNETTFAEPAELVRRASAETVAPQGNGRGHRPKAPVVECAQAVHNSVQPIGSLEQPNEVSHARYAAPVDAQPEPAKFERRAREKRTRRSVIVRPPVAQQALQPHAVQPLGVFIPRGE